ncbi:hypothetical protein Tco_0806527 [Tanacetum coccineum]
MRFDTSDGDLNVILDWLCNVSDGPVRMVDLVGRIGNSVVGRCLGGLNGGECEGMGESVAGIEWVLFLSIAEAVVGGPPPGRASGGIIEEA